MSHNTIDDPSRAIAIIGMAGRFPRAKNLDAFWQNLVQGREVIHFFSKEELRAAGVDEKLIDHPDYVPARAVLEDAECFDEAFFGYSPREADVIDPQQRIFLECAWTALEAAGYNPESTGVPVGVYGGLSMNHYLLNNLMSNVDLYQMVGYYQIMLGNDKDFLTTRVSYKLNLKGPSFNLQTACSTSLVAVQQACQALLNYQCDMALAGGVSVQSPRAGGYLYQPGMIMSPDGHCRAFDHKAQGIVSGEGVGIVVLKRYVDAVRDRDTIHAVIRGAAINNDGATKVGYTAPSVDGQAEAIMVAQAVGGVAPETITYVETHGTGTELGDPIEISALTQAFRAGTDENQFCAIGSVKTNMGHLDAAAGIAGLMKTVLALKQKTIPPSLNYEKPNPRIDFANTPFFVNATAKEWKTDRLPRRAGVSSFGIGGTNSHVVLEEAPKTAFWRSKRPVQVLLISARTESALSAAVQDLTGWLHRNPTESLADAAYTLQIGRKVFKHRLAVACTNSAEAISALEDPNSKLRFFDDSGAGHQTVVFLFPGQGAQYVNMGIGLYQTEEVFREQVDNCAEILKPHLNLDLREILYPTPDLTQQSEELLQQTWITQPALFTIEYAMAQLLMSWGVKPRAMIGHSIGEYTAACLAGVFSLEDGLALVAMRGKLMQSLPGGSMLSIPMAERELEKILPPQVSIATVNAPGMTVVSGPDEAITSFQQTLTSRGIASRRLRTSHAFHSAMMDPILGSFTRLAGTIILHDPQIPFLSNLSGGWISAEQATSPAYWTAHLRSTVRFAQNIETVGHEAGVLLEVGPGQMLGTLARQQTGSMAKQVILASMRHPHDPSPDAAFLAGTLGKLWAVGVEFNWEAYHARESLYRIELPTYPFERKRHWVEPSKPSNDSASRMERQPLENWFYLPSWQRSAWAAVPSGPERLSKQNECWLVFIDSLGVGEAILNRLKSKGKPVVTILPGNQYAQTGENSFTVHPERKDDYIALLGALSDKSLAPTCILHLWTLSNRPPRLEDGPDESFTLGFSSLLSLAQAFGEKARETAVRMLVVTNQMQEVTGGEELSAFKSLITGPCLVIPQEYPDLYCRCVDVVLTAEYFQPESAAVVHLLDELPTTSSEPIIAHRGNHRWMRTYIRQSLPDSKDMSLPLREGGVYLITGGYGGIGLTLAGQIAKTVQANLILVGRSGLPERSTWQNWLDEHTEQDRTSVKIRAVQAIEASGALVLCLKADAADKVEMKAVIEQARKYFGHLDGVIHAAGTAGGGIIQLKSIDQAQKVIHPKVDGALVLDKLLAGDPPDFMVLCSSINGIIGAPGQVDYAAANAFLDAYAQQRTAEENRTKIISINWGTWQEVGMAVETDVPAQLKRRKEENLRQGIRPQEGWEAFKRVFSSGSAQVIVSPQDLQVIIGNLSGAQSRNNEKPLDLSPSDEGNGLVSQGQLARPEMDTNYAAPVTEIEKYLGEVWESLIGVSPVGLQDNFFELGGHSLLATQVLSRIRDRFQVDLPLRTFFEVNTVAEIAKRVEAAVWMERNKQVSNESSEDREELTL